MKVLVRLFHLRRLQNLLSFRRLKGRLIALGKAVARRWQDPVRSARFLLVSGTLLAAVCAAGTAFQARWRIGIDPQAALCLGYRIYLVDTRDKTPAVGGVFLFLSEGAEPVYPDGTKLGKRIAAAEGDWVEITERFDILVNGRQIAKGLWHLRDADPALLRERFVGRRRLGANEYWMTGDSPKSFDSRYFGPVRGERILGRAYGIF